MKHIKSFEEKILEIDSFSGGGAYPGPNLINNDPASGTGGSIGGENTPMGAEWKATGPTATTYPNKYNQKIKTVQSKESKRRKSALAKLKKLDKVKMKSFDDFQKETTDQKETTE